MGRWILHLDMDAFFAAVEQQARPSLRGRAIAVCSDPKGRSVIAAASYEAKSRGVSSGMPIFKARALCPQLILVKADFQKYQKVHQQIFKILLHYSPEIEPASIDEFFVDVSHHLENNFLASAPNRRQAWSLAHLGKQIKQELCRQLGKEPTASIGIGPNKLIAKLASEAQKPNGLVAIEPAQIEGFLSQLELKDLWGLGPKTAQKLGQLGIRTVQELQQASDINLRQIFGINGYRLKSLALGKGSMGLEPFYEAQPPKSIGHQLTLPENLTSKAQIKPILAKLASKVGWRLRQKGYQAKTLKLTLRDKNFITRSFQSSLYYPTFLDKILYQTSSRLLESILLESSVRLVGITAADLVAVKNCQQLSLWSHEENRAYLLQRAIDRINQQTTATIMPARALMARWADR